MRNHLFVFLVVLIFSTSLNLSSLGQHLDSTREGEKLKANNRRASGLVAYPRIGRNSDMVNFARSSRAAGIVQYPRVGRSDLPISNVHFNDMVPDQDFLFYNAHDADLNLAVDQDYEGFTGRSMSPKQKGTTIKDPSWLFPNRLQASKEYRASQKVDDSRSFYPPTRGSKSSHLSLSDYTPRLGREIDIERPFCK